MAKKLAKAQMGRIIKKAAKTVWNKPIPRGLPSTIGTGGAAAYVLNEVYGEKKKPIAVSDTTKVKKKIGGAFDKYKSKKKK